MENKEVTLSNKSYTVKEIKYKDVIALSDLSKAESGKRLLQLATDLTDEDYENLTMSDGVKLTKVVNEVNGLNDMGFQQPANASK